MQEKKEILGDGSPAALMDSWFKILNKLLCDWSAHFKL